MEKSSKWPLTIGGATGFTIDLDAYPATYPTSAVAIRRTGSIRFIRRSSIGEENEISADERALALILCCWLLCFEANLLQHFRLAIKFGLTRRKFVDAQQEGENVCVLLSRQAAGRSLWHRFANAVEQIAQRQSVPIGLESAAGEGRSGFSSREHVTVTRGAFFLIDGLATFGLLLGIHAIPNRTRLRRGLCAQRTKG